MAEYTKNHQKRATPNQIFLDRKCPDSVGIYIIRESFAPLGPTSVIHGNRNGKHHEFTFQKTCMHICKNAISDYKVQLRQLRKTLVPHEPARCLVLVLLLVIPFY